MNVENNMTGDRVTSELNSSGSDADHFIDIHKDISHILMKDISAPMKVTHKRKNRHKWIPSQTKREKRPIHDDAYHPKKFYHKLVCIFMF